MEKYAYTLLLRPIVRKQDISLTKGDENKYYRHLNEKYSGKYLMDRDLTEKQILIMYERINNEQLQKLYNRPNIIAFIRNKRLEWFVCWKAYGLLIKKSTDGKNELNKTPERLESVD